MSYIDMPRHSSTCVCMCVEVGVSHMADVHHHTISPEDTWLIMATDGIWEFLSGEEVKGERIVHTSHGMQWSSSVAKRQQRINELLIELMRRGHRRMACLVGAARLIN